MEQKSRKIKEDEASFEMLFNKYYAILSGFAYRFIKDDDTSKDIVQNVFIKFYAVHASLEITSTIEAYLYKAVYNECLNELRKNNVRKHHIQEYGEFVDTVYFDHAVEQNEREKSIYLAIEKLPPKCKEIFMLSRVHGRRNQEIAEELGISTRTVETQISIALKRLRKVLLVWLLVFY